jgi:ubiquinone/menaquinone biosynthesis C-methylase UbiE
LFKEDGSSTEPGYFIGDSQFAGGNGMALSKSDIQALYQRRANNYDLSANLYYLIGFREHSYRKRAVALLQLKPGDTVVELGCGTGLNFALFQQAIGPAGKIIGIDLSPDMLAQAEDRIQNHGWTNVELVRRDAARYTFPDKVDGIISSFAITLAPEYDLIIKRGADSLQKGKRFVILDLKMPQQMPQWLVRFGISITRPFGVTRDLALRHPWESIKRYLKPISLTDLYLGFAYIAVGERQ